MTAELRTKEYRGVGPRQVRAGQAEETAWARALGGNQLGECHQLKRPEWPSKARRERVTWVQAETKREHTVATAPTPVSLQVKREPLGNFEPGFTL